MTLVRGHMDQGKLSAARWAVTHPVQARSLVRWLRGLPRTMVAPSDDRAGAVLRKRFAGMGLLRTGRHAQAALVLPPTAPQYWVGQKRKVFRNKMAAARRGGLSWRVLDPAETAAVVQAVCDGVGWDRDARADLEAWLEVPLEAALATAAFSPDGDVLAVCLAVASGGVAQIRWAMSVSKGPARWAAFAALVEQAYARRIPAILVGPMIGKASEDEYFQRRVGFQPSNIAVAPDPSPSPGFAVVPVARRLARDRGGTDNRVDRRLRRSASAVR